MLHIIGNDASTNKMSIILMITYSFHINSSLLIAPWLPVIHKEDIPAHSYISGNFIYLMISGAPFEQAGHKFRSNLENDIFIKMIIISFRSPLPYCIQASSSYFATVFKIASIPWNAILHSGKCTGCKTKLLAWDPGWMLLGRLLNPSVLQFLISKYNNSTYFIVLL